MPWPARLLYALVLWLALPLVVLRLFWRGWRNPDYRPRRRERFGFVPAGIPPGAVWFHTVSAGESIAAAPLIRQLALARPELPILVTTMTPTGAAQVQRLLGDRVHHCYAPYDFGFAVARFLRLLQPRLLVLMETELWPNLIGRSKARGMPVLAINARLSERSARGYGRLGWLVRPMLAQLDFVACQYPDHLQRFLALGLPPSAGAALGRIKFDARLPADHAQQVATLASQWRLGSQRPVWIAASTHAGEDEQVLAAQRLLVAQRPDALLILVPRHPERFAAAAELAAKMLLSRRLSQGPGADSDRLQVLVADSMGQLLILLGLAQVAFVGGSLVPVGGHNPIEPALVGLPVLMGPSVFNFADVVARFQTAGVLQQVADAAALAAAVQALLADRAHCQQLGQQAQQVVTQNQGAGERLLRLLLDYLPAA